MTHDWLPEIDEEKALARDRARMLTHMVSVIHRSESEASPFSCLPHCACGWVGTRVRGWNADKFVPKAMAQYGRHTLEQYRQADPTLWAEIDAYNAKRVEEKR